MLNLVLIVGMQIFDFWNLKALAIQPFDDFVNQSLIGTGRQRKQNLLVMRLGWVKVKRDDVGNVGKTGNFFGCRYQSTALIRDRYR